MIRFAKVLSAMGALYLVISISAGVFLENAPMFHTSGMHSIGQEAWIETKRDWLMRLMVGFMNLGLVGVVFFFAGGILYLSAKLAKWLARPAIQL